MKKRNVITFLLVIIIPVLFLAPSIHAAGDYGLKETTKKGKLNDALKVEEINDSAGGALGWITQQTGSLIGAVLSFVGVIFLILMIYAGILWMTAGGNQEQVSKAKNLITSSIIGLIIVFGAYAITSYLGQVIS